MNNIWRALVSSSYVLCILFTPCIGSLAAQPDTVLPAGVKPVWDLEKASREQTATRERLCLNGLWRWQPAGTSNDSDPVPNASWGYFKVPGFWPGRNNYIQEDSQTLFEYPSWKSKNWRQTTAAWYQRDMVVPKEWAGRRIFLRAVPFLPVVSRSRLIHQWLLFRIGWQKNVWQKHKCIELFCAIHLFASNAFRLTGRQDRHEDHPNP